MIATIATRPDVARFHLAPILAAMPDVDAPDAVLVGSHADLCKARRAGYRRIVLAQHGIGQSYGDGHPAYPGGRDNDDVGLFLVPNETAADRWRDRYPRARVAVVGCPRLDTLPRRAPGPFRIAVSFHWRQSTSAFAWHRDAVLRLSRALPVLGHAHPRNSRVPAFWARASVPFEPDFDEVCRQADVYVSDASSTLYEFAATGRPVVVLNAPWFPSGVGLRFGEAASIGVQVDTPDQLEAAVCRAVALHPEDVKARERALDVVYAHRSGGARRAADAIVAYLEETASWTS